MNRQDFANGCILPVNNRSRSMKYFFSISVCLLIFAACENDINEVNQFFSKEETSVETAKGIEMLYSDSSILRMRIASPILIRHLDNRQPWQEFPDGFTVDFFDENGKVTGSLSAKYATRQENENKFITRDSVVWESLKGERLESEELIWDEAADKVHTDKFVILRRPSEIVYGHGFEANQEFTRWTIRAIEGRLKANGLTRDFKN
ncbi:MAG: LPS export ABC transporter periplasmic protein LptC [Saprospiraceae bacterium]|nr:MAG: LPS export ABC transporter periplasmic protein LptC [Saprospiraceae bacterium]